MIVASPATKLVGFLVGVTGLVSTAVSEDEKSTLNVSPDGLTDALDLIFKVLENAAKPNVTPTTAIHNATTATTLEPLFFSMISPPIFTLPLQCMTNHLTLLLHMESIPYVLPSYIVRINCTITCLFLSIKMTDFDCVSKVGRFIKITF